MSKSLDELIALARSFQMTPEQQDQQRKSFVYGNTNIENARVTRDTVDKAALIVASNVKRVR